MLVKTHHGSHAPFNIQYAYNLILIKYNFFSDVSISIRCFFRKNVV